MILFYINFSTQVKDKLPKHKLLIFTGPIDAFYASQGWDKLEYRSIFFEVRIKDVPILHSGPENLKKSRPKNS